MDDQKIEPIKPPPRGALCQLCQTQLGVGQSSTTQISTRAYPNGVVDLYHFDCLSWLEEVENLSHK